MNSLGYMYDHGFYVQKDPETARKYFKEAADNGTAGAVTKILEQRRPPSLSSAAMETLAIVAYYQPVTAAYISRIRGVDSSYSVSSLTEKGLIEGKGRLEAPGRPTLYGTTDLFLRTMQITNLSDLPKLPEVASTEGIQQLQQAIDALQGKDKGGEQLTLQTSEG